MNRRTQLMFGMFTKATAAHHDYLKFAMAPEDVNTWYILIENVKGEEDEFEGGQYLVRMKAPANFPFSPPEFYFMTPNGLYDVEKKVCISIGEYHKESYQATLGMLGFAEQLVSGMTDVKFLGSGISILRLTAEDRRKFTRESVNYNLTHNRQYLDLITEACAGYSSRWARPTPPAEPTPTSSTDASTTATPISVEGAAMASAAATAAETAPVVKQKKKASSMKFLLD